MKEGKALSPEQKSSWSATQGTSAFPRHADEAMTNDTTPGQCSKTLTPNKRRQTPRLQHLAERSATGIAFKRIPGADGPIEESHRDDYFMLSLLTSGEAKATIDFKPIALKSGEGAIVVPGQLHRASPGSFQPCALNLFVSPENLCKETRERFETWALSNPEPVIFDDTAAADLEMLYGLLERHESNHIFALSTARAIAALFAAALPNRQNGCPGRYTAITIRLKHLLDSLGNEAAQGTSACAAALGISGAYLNEAVRETTGMSAGEFVRRHTVIKAKRMLTSKSMTVQEVAFSLGYDDTSYFSRLFRKAAGVSPTEFRKNLG